MTESKFKKYELPIKLSNRDIYLKTPFLGIPDEEYLCICCGRKFCNMADMHLISEVHEKKYIGQCSSCGEKLIPYNPQFEKIYDIYNLNYLEISVQREE